MDQIHNPTMHQPHIPQCTGPVSHNAPFCDRNVHIFVKTGVYLSNALWDLWDWFIGMAKDEILVQLILSYDIAPYIMLKSRRKKDDFRTTLYSDLPHLPTLMPLFCTDIYGIYLLDWSLCDKWKTIYVRKSFLPDINRYKIWWYLYLI